MKLNSLVLSIIAAFFMTTSFAQTEVARNQIDFNIGYTTGAYKNLILSPVVLYRYNNPVLSLGYTRKTKKARILAFRLKHWNTTLESEKIPQLNLNYSNSSLRIDYLFPTIEKEKLTLYTGFFSQTAEVLQKSEETLIAGELRQKFALTGMLRYELNERHALSAQLSIPFFWLVHGNLDSDIYSFKRYQGYNYRLGYEAKLTNKFDLSLAYSAIYDRIQSNNVFRELQNQLTVGIHYNF